MARLITFDQKTAAALRREMPQHQTFEHGAADVVDFAMGGPETLVAVLPVDAPNQAGVAVFRRPKIERFPLPTPEPEVNAAQTENPVQRTAQEKSPAPEVPAPPVDQPLSSSLRADEPIQFTPLRIRAGGFLGLRDEAVFEEEQKPPQKRSWWRKFWDED
jgi:hypothetical protein